MYYRVKNYVSLNKTSLTYPAHSICLGQILTNAWSITVAVVITARNGVQAMSVPAPLVMKWILRIRIALTQMSAHWPMEDANTVVQMLMEATLVRVIVDLS